MRYQGPWLEDYLHRERTTLDAPRMSMQELKQRTVEREIEAARKAQFAEMRRRLDQVFAEIEIGEELDEVERAAEAARLRRVELRYSQSLGGTKRLEGYVLRWSDQSSRICKSEGCFTERVARGAFRDSIVHQRVVAVVEHDMNRIFARQQDGTLRIAEDDVGMRVLADIPRGASGERISEAVARGELAEWSFSVTANREERVRDSSGRMVRRILEGDLHEVSLVPRGAYGQPVRVIPRSATVADLRRLLEAAAA